MPLPVLERGGQGRIVRRTGRRGPATSLALPCRKIAARVFHPTEKCSIRQRQNPSHRLQLQQHEPAHDAGQGNQITDPIGTILLCLANGVQGFLLSHKSTCLSIKPKRMRGDRRLSRAGAATPRQAGPPCATWSFVGRPSRLVQPDEPRPRPASIASSPGIPAGKPLRGFSTLPRFPHPQTKSPGTWPGLPTRSRLLRDADLLRERLDIHMVIEHLAGSHLDQVQASQLPVPVAVGLTALDLLLPFRCQKMIDLGQQCHVYPCRAHACPPVPDHHGATGWAKALYRSRYKKYPAEPDLPCAARPWRFDHSTRTPIAAGRYISASISIALV
jgi:hypothetical protein